MAIFPEPARTPEDNVENIREEIKSYLASALHLFEQLPSGPKTTGPPGTQPNEAQSSRVVVLHGTPQLPRPPVKSPTLSVHNSDKLPSFSAKHAEENPSDVEQSLFHDPSKFTINCQDSSPQPQQVIGLQNNDDASKQSPSLEEHHTNVIPSSFCPVPVSSQSHSQSSPLQSSNNVVKESSQAKPRDLTVSAQLNGQSIKALVDTGAAISVIDKEVLQEVYKEQFPELQTDNLGDVKTVSGEALPVLGMFTTALDIANGTYLCTFIVVQDLPYDALLGRDFLRENGAIINLKESTLRLDGKRDEPYPERELAEGLTCDQSPVQPTIQSFLTTLCIALYLLTASHATVPDQNVYKVQITPRIYAVQKQTFDIRNAAGVPVQVCPTNPKEPYKIGQATDESKKMREPPQPVQQRSTKPFPPMTSSDADFPARPGYDVPRSSSTLNDESLSKERS